MALFGLWKRPTAAAEAEPREPVYSDVGEALSRLLSGDFAKWVWWAGSRTLHHPTVEIYFTDNGRVNSVKVHRDEVMHLLTGDDLWRLQKQAVCLRDTLKAKDAIQERQRVLRALPSTPAPTFDTTARSLAVAVLGGDRTAARALVDYLLERPELLREGGQ